MTDHKYRLWDKIDQYVIACGGQPDRYIHGSGARSKARSEIEAAALALGKETLPERGDPQAAHRVRCPKCKRRLWLPDDNIIPKHSGRGRWYGQLCGASASLHPRATGRPLEKLAPRVVSRLVKLGPIPYGVLVHDLKLTDVERDRVSDAIDKCLIPGITKRRRNRKPRSIVGIEGDSRRWQGRPKEDSSK